MLFVLICFSLEGSMEYPETPNQEQHRGLDQAVADYSVDAATGSGLLPDGNTGDVLTPQDVQRLMPAVLRLESIESEPVSRAVRVRATIFHEAATLRVVWTCKEPNPALVAGCLVSIRWLATMSSVSGHVENNRLVPALRPDATIDLFGAVPYGWVRDRQLLARASALWSRLPSEFRGLFNAILRDGARFRRYLMGPSSIENHHNLINGNFRHSIEVAELALALAERNNCASTPIVVLAALTHDAAKADEYRFNRSRRRFELSDEGVLVGHRDRLQLWIASAIARYNLVLPEVQELGLIHALTAAKGAPAHLGLREPRSLEATILSTADRLSGEGEMVSRHANPKAGFGRYHRHLKGRPFVSVAENERGVL